MDVCHQLDVKVSIYFIPKSGLAYFMSMDRFKLEGHRFCVLISVCSVGLKLLMVPLALSRSDV